jgi:hypothetical protein
MHRILDASTLGAGCEDVHCEARDSGAKRDRNRGAEAGPLGLASRKIIGLVLQNVKSQLVGTSNPGPKTGNLIESKYILVFAAVLNAFFARDPQ